MSESQVLTHKCPNCGGVEFYSKPSFVSKADPAS